MKQVENQTDSHIYTQLKIMWYVAIASFVIAFIATIN